jgi:membrane-associated phospholipid phosphatase
MRAQRRRPATATEALMVFDQAIDRKFAPHRGRRGPDTVAAVVSNLADYGFVWAVIAGYKGRHRGPARRRATRALAVSGFSSMLLNAGVKRLIARDRPVGALRIEANDQIPVRQPSTSSFPSGHTLAAFCTAVVLADGPAQTAALTAFAGAVAVSRVHLEAHHASDVVGGAMIGSVLGLGLRRILSGR